ncbi:hypothetical protein AKO1_002036 [Acrasis kona]|uniref:Uncharacterized protein n=1 Tax=Acrasis kona TaxID=1008807 RepID=A0AAW2YW17_9EUKA
MLKILVLLAITYVCYATTYEACQQDKIDYVTLRTTTRLNRPPLSEEIYVFVDQQAGLQHLLFPGQDKQIVTRRANGGYVVYTEEKGRCSCHMQKNVVFERTCVKSKNRVDSGDLKVLTSSTSKTKDGRIYRSEKTLRYRPLSSKRSLTLVVREVARAVSDVSRRVVIREATGEITDYEEVTNEYSNHGLLVSKEGFNERFEIPPFCPPSITCV